MVVLYFPNDSAMVFLGMLCLPWFSNVFLWLPHGFPMYSIVFLCIPMFICGCGRCFVSVYKCELADVMWKGTSVEGSYFSLRHRIQVLSAPRGRKTESAFQLLLRVLLGILTIIVGRRPASGRASMRVAKEGSMEGSRMVSKWFFYCCPMCSVGFLWFSYVPSLWFSLCVSLFCLLFANVSLLFPNVFLSCILFSFDFIWFP